MDSVTANLAVMVMVLTGGLVVFATGHYRNLKYTSTLLYYLVKLTFLAAVIVYGCKLLFDNSR